MKRFLMILFFVSVSMFSFSQSLSIVTNDFNYSSSGCEMQDVEYTVSKSKYFFKDREICDPFVMSVGYNAFCKLFVYSIDGETNTIEDAWVAKIENGNETFYIVGMRLPIDGEKKFIPIMGYIVEKLSDVETIALCSIDIKDLDL